MNLILQKKLMDDEKMAELLKQNSYWIKNLNRKEESYKDFVQEMKVKYNLRVTDKINEAIDNIDLISSILETLK